MGDLPRVRSITSDELESFAALTGSSDSAARFAAWVNDRWREKESRPEWCFVVESDSRIIGRVLYWSFPSSATELVLAGLQLDWEGECLEPGTRLLRESIEFLRSTGGTSLSASTISDPATFPEKRADLYRSLGLPVVQQKRRFGLETRTPTKPAPYRLRFRSMENATEKEFERMIARVTEGTLDTADRADRERYGVEEAAARYITLLKEVDPDTGRWQIASDDSGEDIGLVIPQRLDARRGTINYIGIVPERRGHGYADELLRHGIFLLREMERDEVVVDVDALNLPVIAALERGGWSESGRSWRFDLGEARR